MGDIEQLQYGGLTYNKDEMSNLGDMKTQTYVYLKHILDTFKYLINAYKDDEKELDKLVTSFNRRHKNYKPNNRLQVYMLNNRPVNPVTGLQVL